MAWINGQWVDDAMFGGMLGSVPGRTPQAAGDDRDYPYFGGEQGGHTGFTPGTGGGLWPWPRGTDPVTDDQTSNPGFRPGFGTQRDYYAPESGGDPNYGDVGMGDPGLGHPGMGMQQSMFSGPQARMPAPAPQQAPFSADLGWMDAISNVPGAAAGMPAGIRPDPVGINLGPQVSQPTPSVLPPITDLIDTGPQDTRTQKELNVADHAFNVAQRERTKLRLAEDRAKTKRHYAKLRAKGASKQTIAKAKAKSKARGAKIKAQHPTRKSTIIYD